LGIADGRPRAGGLQVARRGRDASPRRPLAALVAAVRLVLVIVLVLVLEKPERRVGDNAPYLKASAGSAASSPCHREEPKATRRSSWFGVNRQLAGAGWSEPILQARIPANRRECLEPRQFHPDSSAVHVLVLVLVLEKPERRVGDNAPYLKAPRRRRRVPLPSRVAEGDAAIQLARCSPPACWRRSAPFSGGTASVPSASADHGPDRAGPSHDPVRHHPSFCIPHSAFPISPPCPIAAASALHR
jgi:hypothetical protein